MEGTFPWAGLAAFVALALLAGWGAAVVVRGTLLVSERELADGLADDLAARLRAFDFGPEHWGAENPPTDLAQDVEHAMRGFGVLEFDLFAPDGRALLSFRARPAAAREPWTEGHDAAWHGEVAVRWESDAAWAGLAAGADSGAIEAWAPVRDGSTVIAVARLRRDLGPAMTAARMELAGRAPAVLGCGLVFWLASWLFVRAARRRAA